MTLIPDMDSMESEKSDVQKQKRILMRILAEELSDSQRQTFLAYHVERKTVEQIAEEQGVNKSTVSRTLKRAEDNVYRITKYFRM